MKNDIVRHIRRHAPTVLGGAFGAFIMYHRAIVLDILLRIGESTLGETHNEDPRNTLIVDEHLLREVREDGAILVYRSSGGTDHFAVIHDPNMY